MDSKLGWVILVLAVLQGVVNAGRNDKYVGYSAFGIKLSSEEDRDFVHTLSESLSLDTWSHGLVEKRDAVVMVDPQNKDSFVEQLNQKGIQHYVAVEDVARQFDLQDAETERAISAKTAAGQRNEVYDSYPRMAEIDEYIDTLAAAYPDLVTVVTAGLSFEGRPVRYLKISSSNFEDASKPIYFLDAGIHSREWVTVPVALYTLHMLLERREAGDEDLISDIDWIVLPVVNPDGWEYTFESDRFWRRTRSFNASISTCYGADGNRNFDYNFNQYGVEFNPCSEVYAGPSAFSEVETQYVRNILLEYLPRIEVYMNIHSFGNYILYGFDDVPAENTVQLHHMGALMGAVMDQYKLPESYYYLVGNGGLILYPAAGNAQDYAQSIGVPFAYTLELPDMGGWWFQVPPAYVPQINHETWQGLKASARLAKIYHDARRNGWTGK